MWEYCLLPSVLWKEELSPYLPSYWPILLPLPFDWLAGLAASSAAPLGSSRAGGLTSTRSPLSTPCTATTSPGTLGKRAGDGAAGHSAGPAATELVLVPVLVLVPLMLMLVLVLVLCWCWC